MAHLKKLIFRKGCHTEQLNLSLVHFHSLVVFILTLSQTFQLVF